MDTMRRHWTSRSTEDFVYRISSDFVLQLEKKMEEEKMSQKALAGRLRVSDGRVSQILRNPGNLTLKKIVEYSHVLGMKVSIVAYDDGDPHNDYGPVNSEIFHLCWKRAGAPRDFFALNNVTADVRPLGPIYHISFNGYMHYSNTQADWMAIPCDHTASVRLSNSADKMTVTIPAERSPIHA
jgi:transcriptional regulator with XRE-family HTH domain